MVFARHYREDRHQKIMANKIALPNLEVHVSHACNLRCRGCSHYSNFGMSVNLSTDQAELWFSTWSAKVRPREFALLGGEPTMNPALSEIGRWMAVGAEHCCEMCPERREDMTP